MKNKILCTIVFSLVLFVFYNISYSAVIGYSYQVSGYIRDVNYGTPVSGVTVTYIIVYDIDGSSFSVTGTSDNNGYYNAHGDAPFPINDVLARGIKITNYPSNVYLDFAGSKAREVRWKYTYTTPKYWSSTDWYVWDANAGPGGGQGLPQPTIINTVLNMVKYNQNSYCAEYTRIGNNYYCTKWWSGTCGPTSAKMIIHYLKYGTNYNTHSNGISTIDPDVNGGSNSTYPMPSYRDLYNYVTLVNPINGYMFPGGVAEMIENETALDFEEKISDDGDTFMINDYIKRRIKEARIPVVANVNSDENGGNVNHFVVVVGVRETYSYYGGTATSHVSGIYQVNPWYIGQWKQSNNSTTGFPYAFYSTDTWLSNVFTGKIGGWFDSYRVVGAVLPLHPPDVR